MANIVDYLIWRGDLTFAKSKLNIVDIVALSQLTVLDLVDCTTYGEEQTLKECAQKYFKDNPDGKPLSFFFPAQINDLFKHMGASKRFSWCKR